MVTEQAEGGGRQGVPKPKGRQHFPAFPYGSPYAVQTEFMRSLYAALEEGGVGLFESPTGTGKTLSIICSALQWQEDRRCFEELVQEMEGEEPVGGGEKGGAEGEEEEPDWMRDWGKGAAKAAEVLAGPGRSSSAPQKPPQKPKQAAEDGAEFLLEEWVEETGTKRKGRAGGGGATSSGDEDTASEDGGGVGAESEATEPVRMQVLFCSRTHSQLSQFIGELRRTPFASSASAVALASRKSLCVNEEVLRLRGAAQINEKCLDMQGSKGRAKQRTGEAAPGKGRRRRPKATARCPFLAHKPEAHETMRSHILDGPLDVEDLGKLGRRLGVCPYYATRRVQPAADVLLMPYSALLSSEAREAFGIRLKGSIVVVDEAHNLVDAINSVHSASLGGAELSAAHGQIVAYQQRFRSRLSPGNLCRLDTLISAASRLRESLGSRGGAVRVMSVNDFLFGSGLDNINLFQLLRYVRENKVVFKVSGYAEAAEAEAGEVVRADPEEQGGGGRTFALRALVGFLEALTNHDADGRVVLETEGDGRLKFVLLNAAGHFSKAVSEAHAVILASGTLSPVDSLVQQLFPSLDSSRIHRFSCGHVVPHSQLLALPLGVGPAGVPLDLRHTARSRPATIDQVGQMLKNLCGVVPQGMVVFFPSFGYMDEVKARLEATGLLRAIEAKKRVFFEPRSSAAVESVLAGYSDACNPVDHSGPAGALLLSVVGGKMSEGINFGDGLGRCVVMVGLPYPNPSDPELKERMAHLDRSAAPLRHHGGRNFPGRPLDGRGYYEDLCMKSFVLQVPCVPCIETMLHLQAVNQCIGRVIRHAGDHAAIVLADQRYAAAVKSGVPSGPLAKLPGWIKPSLTDGITKFGEAMLRLRRFYQSMSTPGE